MNWFDGFWQKVDKRGPDECWLWTAAKDKDGYGIYKRPRPRKGRTNRATRIIWEFAYGPIPEGVLVLHTCDVPSCCNPTHLWLGNSMDNHQDMVAKGRQIFPPLKVGEANGGGGKLTEQDVRAIRKLRATGRYTLMQLGNIYGVTFGMIGHIINRRAWAHVE